MIKEYSKGYRDGYNDALRNADIYSFYPYNIIVECEGETEYDITPKELKKCIADNLTDRESQVIEYRFHQNLSLEDTGKKFGVTKERIRQIEAKALRKLRHYMRSYQTIPMREFVDATHKYDDLLAQYEELSRKYAEEKHVPAPKPEELHTVPIEDLDLSIRSYNCLKRAKINYLDELKKLSEEDLMHIRHLGLKSLREIQRKLSEVS